MFKRLPNESQNSSTQRVVFYADGKPIAAQVGDSVAAALLANGNGKKMEAIRHSVVSESPRAPYCMIGQCFECLVEVDGVANQQACLIEVRDGMQIRRQRGATAIKEVSL